MQEEGKKSSRSKVSIKKLIILLFVLLVIYYGYSWYKGVPLVTFAKPQSEVIAGQTYNYEELSPEMKAAKDAQDRVIIRSILTGLAKELPQEEFVLQEIVNAEAMKRNQPFFSNAINGDKLVIFREAKRAILFRPSENRIINDGKLEMITSNNQQ